MFSKIYSPIVEISSELVEISSDLVEISSELVLISSDLVLKILELLIISTFEISQKTAVHTLILPLNDRRSEFFIFTSVGTSVNSDMGIRGLA